MAETTLDGIYNFLRLSDHLATAGQPTEDELAAIQDAGCQVIVNLLPASSPHALPDEDKIVTALGIDYVSIPVDWQQPEIADIEQFFAVMEASGDKKVFVHCAANMRVSAFVYLYRTLHQQMPPAEAEKDLHRIWEPNERWSRFIEDVTQHYAGH
ncbi:MAG: protein tyrosine phosphatase family protein [Armatimonadota bacterium]|nr:protein tyrosine phosphatase family protein [Armatimonadota bacterium]